MLTITDITVRKSYPAMAFETNLDVQVGDKSYNRATVQLTDEQTQKVVDLIVALASETLTLAVAKPEPVVVAQDEALPEVAAADREAGADRVAA